MNSPLSADLDHVLDHTRPLWDELRGGRLFITGGTGFVGSWLLESFAWANERLALGAQALVLTRNPEAFAKKAPHLSGRTDIRFQTGDVRNFEFPAGTWPHVIHAATEASARLNEENPGLMLETIVTGTRRALEMTAERGGKKFLLTSSGAVYGRQPPDLERVGEDYAGGPEVSSPQSAYGEGKRMSELLCAIQSRAGGFEAKIARCFAFVGPYLPLDVHFAIGNFIRDAMAGGPIMVKGDGTPYRSYLYAADLAIWLWSIFFQGAGGRPYNVGSPHSLTIAEVAAAVSRSLPGNVPVMVAQKPAPDQPAQRYVPDTARAENELGLREWVKLEEGIRRTAQWRQRGR
ncbi:MAG: NAD(P)-dependent oxidoreductase [Verrucomicrobiota bacterium]|jgi:dTDP-glucose 4,6-dehydratase